MAKKKRALKLDVDLVDDTRLIFVGKVDQEVQENAEFQRLAKLLELVGKKQAEEIANLSKSFGFPVKMKPVFKLIKEG